MIACDHDIDDLSPEERYRVHWTEDEYGQEYRIDCGCPCEACQEY